jgi:Spy/CpxP family protein refolding chaperone
VKTLLVILSVALNAAFVATWLARAAPGEADDKPPADGGCAALREKLGASDAQWHDMEARQAAYQQFSEAVCREMKRLRGELLDLLAAAKPDREAIRHKQQQLLAAQGKMQDLVVEQLLEEKTILKPEQQKVLFELIRSRCGCPGRDLLRPGGKAAGEADCP